MKFTVTTVAFSDDAANSDKYYRTYVGENGLELRQNARIGVTGAVASLTQHTSEAAAESSANDQIRAKRRKGYKGDAVATFDYPDNKLPTNRKDERARYLFQAFTASGKPGARPQELLGAAPVAPRVIETQVETDGLEVLLEMVMAGINTAIADPAEGATAYASLRGKIKEAEEKLGQVIAYYETLEDLVMA